eukprot:TRINITY_DN67763_c0_g1_i1.p1 TRINITY_DN67763_c0_g1~~TRINITY_DN67763_c0_g1_i1.p1  ORF type:complete len:353 (+),score=55.01 TRINITY_DN67763_c0_g1_i1:247-1305(+)
MFTLSSALLLLCGRQAVAAAPSVVNGTAFDSGLEVYSRFAKDFDYDLFRKSTGMRAAPEAHVGLANRAHCDLGSKTPVLYDADSGERVSLYPGGITQRAAPDFATVIAKLAASAGSPGEAATAALRTQALQTGMGLVQTVASAVAHVVPPMIPPPVWTNMPLPCAPMVTGHNCFGAVLHPITMADFLVADLTDKAMDGYVSSFPSTYQAKVGKTSDKTYKACFAAYMSMSCAAAFPRCTVPQSRDEALPVGGRVPICMHLCLLPLVACPGFWIDDIAGSCQFVSVPPVCTQAFYWNMWRLPPQYSSNDDAHPFPELCPKLDYNGLDGADDPALYDDVTDTTAGEHSAQASSP